MNVEKGVCILACAGAVALAAGWRFAKSGRRSSAASRPEGVFMKLRVMDGLSAGQEFVFTQTDTITIGRKASNAIALSDTGVSGRHCRITFDAAHGTWCLADVGSLNGTFLNRALIEPEERSDSLSRPLAHGDVILIGETTTLEVECVPANTRAPKDVEARSAGDNIAQVLLTHLEQNPLPAGVLDSLATFAHAPVRLKGAKIQKLGARAKASGACEDTFSWHLPLAGGSGGASPLSMACVCDGHCGHETARAVQELLPSVLGAAVGAQRLHAGASLRTPLEETFLEVDRRVEGKDGCTMSLLVLDADADRNVYLQVANVGDSAVVCADFGQMMKMHLTDNHRVSQAAELERLKRAGALLTHNGTRLMGLNLSRSIGDRALKDEQFGFIAQPYVSTVVKVEPCDSLLLVMASDGLWDVTNADLVMKIAHRVLRTDHANLEVLAKCLMYHAIQRRSLDDVTIIVMLIESDAPAAPGAAGLQA